MHTSVSSLIAAAVITLSPITASAEILTYNVPKMGQSVSYFMGSDNPLVGQRVVNARIYLYVDSFDGSDAANFFTDHSFPIAPDDGNTNAIVLAGLDLGWTGSGHFEYFLETKMFNGEIVPARFGGETPGFDFDGEVLPGSRYEFDVEPVPAPAGAGVLMAGGLMLAGRRRR